MPDFSKRYLRSSAVEFFAVLFVPIRVIRGLLFSAMGGRRRFRGSLAGNLNQRRG